MEHPEHDPEELSAEQDLAAEREPADTDEPEMTGTVDEELEDRGDL